MIWDLMIWVGRWTLFVPFLCAFWVIWDIYQIWEILHIKFVVGRRRVFTFYVFEICGWFWRTLAWHGFRLRHFTFLVDLTLFGF